MRTLNRVIASAVIASAGLGFGPAKADTTHLVEKGTSADVDVFFTSPDGCLQIAVSINAATSVTRSGTPGTSSGMVASVFRDDFCAGTFEFGAAFVTLAPNQLQVSGNANTASLAFTIPIDTFDFEGNTTTRTLSANVQLQATSNSTSGSSHIRLGRNDVHFISNGHSVANEADVAGQVSLDGLPLLPQGFPLGTIEKSLDVITSVTN